MTAMISIFRSMGVGSNADSPHPISESMSDTNMLRNHRDELRIAGLSVAFIRRIAEQAMDHVQVTVCPCKIDGKPNGILDHIRLVVVFFRKNGIDIACDTQLHRALRGKIQTNGIADVMIPAQVCGNTD